MAVNLLASMMHTKFDLTKEKRYTITSTTKNLLKKLDDKLEVQVFLSGDLPAGFQTSEFLLEHGFLDFIVDRKDMKKQVSDFLRMVEKK